MPSQNHPSEESSAKVSDLQGDVPLTDQMSRKADFIKNEKEGDPLGSSGSQQASEVSTGELHAFASMSTFHPFMKLFNVCARSMYFDKPDGQRMRSFSMCHPRFRRCCMVADFIFTTVCTVIIVMVLLYLLAKLAGIPLPWEKTVIEFDPTTAKKLFILHE